MRRLRKKQLDLDNRIIGARNESNTIRNYKNIFESSRSSRSSSCNEQESITSASLSSKNRDIRDLDALEDEGLRNDEVDKFLNSRSKRGRGAVGSRMDEAGPYLPSRPYFNLSESGLEKKKIDFLGPKKPYHLKCDVSPDDQSGEDRRKGKGGSSKGQYKKQKTKGKLRDEEKKKKKKKRKEKRHKYH